MSVRVKLLTVLLAEDLPQEDAARLVEAITLMRGVLEVSTVPADMTDTLARQRAKAELWRQIQEVLS